MIDLFSGGGVVLQQSLMSKRRCISFCKDEIEAMNLESMCSKILEDNPQIQEWCGAGLSLQNEIVKLDDA